MNKPANQVSKSAEQVADAVSAERRQLDAIETARAIGYRDGHIDGRNEARAQTASAASPVAGVSAKGDGCETGPVTELLNSMKVIDRSHRYMECRADLLTHYMYELVRLRAQPSAEGDGWITFRQFQRMNLERCRTAFKMCDDWTLNDWAVALIGEAGEMCNVLKKVRRGDFTLEHVRGELLKELADILTYADLMVSQLDASTDDILLAKFNEVSARIGYVPTPPSVQEEKKEKSTYDGFIDNG